MRAPLRSSTHGFTLIEVMISLAIATVLMVALSGLFVQSVKSRQQVDRDGQKIENGRYALDVLAEDIRLAGYWGIYSPNSKWSSVDWKPVSPFADCSTINLGSGTLAADRAAKIIAGSVGWVDSLTAPMLPAPIMGFEVHALETSPPTPASLLSTTISKCLPDYYGGDVIVVRRASTATTALSNLKTNKTYLQVSSCRDDSPTYFVAHAGVAGLSDAQPFVDPPNQFTNKAFSLRPLGCTSTSETRAVLRELITRVYYLAANNESNDGIPTLKVLDLGDGSVTPRTIAPGVENLHIEYGLDKSGDDGATDTYQYSTNNPIRLTSVAPDNLLGIKFPNTTLWRSNDLDTYNRWDDVMAVKLYVVVRDLETTAGYTNTSSFIMGQASPITPANNTYKTRMSTSSIRVVNMSSRREQ